MVEPPVQQPHKPETPDANPTQERGETTPVLRTEFQIPKAVIDHYVSSKGKQNRQEWWRIGIEAATLLAVVAYALIASRQLAEMHKATKAATESTASLRQQLVGTQATRVFYHLDPFGTDGLRVWFDPRGIVAAKKVRLEFTAVRKSIPTLEDIETPIHRIAYEETISSEQPTQMHEFSLPGFTPAVLEATRRTEQTIMVTGEFSYDNGFGDVHTEQVCKYWLSGIPNRTTDRGGANEFVDCENFPVRLSNILKARQETETKK